MNNKEKSTLMLMSWEIQTAQKNTRRKALLAAWAIHKALPIALKFLQKQHSKKRAAVPALLERPTLF